MEKLKKLIINNKIKITVISLTVLFVLLILTIFSFFRYKESLANNDVAIWDGTIAESFSAGNGSYNDPYIISNGSEFARLFSVLNSEEYLDYFNKYYEITINIDLNGFEFSFLNSNNVFSGHINGNGYTISNFKVEKSYDTENEQIYGFFSSIKDAEIDYLNIEDVVINAKKTENNSEDNLIEESSQSENIEGKTTYISLFGKDAENTVFSNISLNNIKIEGENNAISSVLFINDNGNNSIYNVNIDLESDIDSSQLIYKYKDSDVYNIVYTNNELKLINDYELDSNLNIYHYTITESLTFDNLTSEKFLDLFNNNSLLKWQIDNNKINIQSINLISENVSMEDLEGLNKRNEMNLKAFSLAPLSDNDFTPQESGIRNNIVYVNDLIADYNYYIGLNYTEPISETGEIPTGENTGRYTDNKLIMVELIYSGTDGDDTSLVGKVSPTENANKYIYYKYYPLNADNTITIELIDNPFTARPADKGFNGWEVKYNDSILSYDSETYTRYVTIPTNGLKKISIEAYAIWENANIQTGGTGQIASLDNAGMKQAIKTITETTTETIEYDCDPYFNQNVKTIPTDYSGRVNSGRTIPAGSYYYAGTNNTVVNTSTDFKYASTNTTCNTSGVTGGGTKRCYYFTPTTITQETEYDSNETYRIMYQYSTNTYRYTTDVTDYISYNTCTREETTTTTREESMFNNGDSAVGYYYSVGTNYTSSTGLYYDSYGRNCNSSGNSCGSGAYKLIQYNDQVNNSDGTSISVINEVDGEVTDFNKYYYLVTRDMNILVNTSSGTNLSNYMSTKPYTLTSSYDGTSISNTTIPTNAASLSADMTIENIKIAGVGGSSASTSVTSTSSLGANCHNLKIGRNVTYRNNGTDSEINKIFYGVYGVGNNYGGSSSSPDRFKVIVESGTYDFLLSGTASSGTQSVSTYYLNAKFIYGSDYDRINNDDSKLKVYFNALSTVKDNFNSSSTKKNIPASEMIVKSGRYGKTSSNGYSTDNAYGIYVGGRTTTHYANALRVLKLEGGDVNIINGGPCVETNLSTNSTAFFMTGGTVREVYGGAGTTTTYGNRIVSITGGTVTYSIFGGSDAYNSGSEGLLTGSTLVYVGGNAVIGDENLSSTATLFNVTSGNVFGAGNGADGGTSAGIVSNSHVIINGGTIRNSVYAGGNHGSVGTNNSSTTSKARLDILSGTIMGSVYGAGQSAGGGYNSAQSEGTSTIIGDYYIGYTTAVTSYSEITTTVTRDNTGEVTEGPTTTTRTTNGVVPANVYLPDGSLTTTQIACTDSVIGAEVTGPTTETSTSRTNEGSWWWPDYYTTTTVTTTTATTCYYATGQAHTGDIYNSSTGYYIISDNKFVQVTPDYDTERDGSNTYNHSVLINLYNGEVKKQIYGGSNIEGILYGNVAINLYKGKANGVYGGGRGVSGSTTKVEVMGNTDVKSYSANNSDLEIGSLYGGSAFGAVNKYGNTTVTIDGGTFTNVYGGGEGDANTQPITYGDITVTVKNGIITNLYGGNNLNGIPSRNVFVYLKGGTISNAFGGGSSSSVKTSNIYLQGATTGNVFGGSNSSGTVTTSNVFIESGTANYVFGGNNIGGETITSNVKCTGGTVSNADNNAAVYGGGKNATTTNTNVLMDGTTVKYVFGGGESAAVQEQTNVDIKSGTIERVYGGSNITGDVEVSNVNGISGTVSYIYGGGKNATVGTTNVKMTGTNATYVFGGGESADITTQANVDIDGGTITNVYGGSNTTGTVAKTVVNYNTGSSSYVFGGNNEGGSVSETIVNVNDGTIENVFGGGNQVGVTTTNVNLNGGTITNTYGGSNETGDVGTSNINAAGGSSSNLKIDVDVTSVDVNPYWQDTNYTTVNTLAVTITNKTDQQIDDWEVQLLFPDKTVLYSNYSSTAVTIVDNSTVVNSVNINYGKNSLAPNGSYTFTFDVYSTATASDFSVRTIDLTPSEDSSSTLKNITVNNLYGGNNKGGITENVNINLTRGTYGNIFGGGNEAVTGNNVLEISGIVADNIYGGGNKAKTNNNAVLTLDSSIVNGSVYCGGNEAAVGNNTYLTVKDSNISNNVFGGGNAAGVDGNAYTNVMGNTEIGQSLFGGGNSGTIGLEANDNAKVILNVTGAKVGKNVYGGCNTSIVYGETLVNVGTNAVNNSDLTIGNINITGTIFGGGESNAEGSTIIDYDFISVTQGIDINIDGTGYLNNNYEFTLSGSIFGSGNASQSAGESNIYIGHLGTRDNPSRNISIQRSNNVTIDSSVIELKGTKDSANYYGDIKYSLNRIDTFKIKNGTTLLLRENANLLRTFTSLVDVNGTEEVATVTIDEDTNSVTKNVDNRLYLLAGQVLNVAQDADATTYGKVTGMTFLGMYNSYANGSISYGIYDYDMETGSAADGGDVIIGGSYVLGLHANNHDITKDGFYTNYINDEYTSVTTNYVEPTPPDANFYRWIIGTSSINYSFTLTASKYASLGTEALSLIDFADGNTTFTVLGFNSEGLSSGVNIVDASNIPKLASSPALANHTLGLTMKTETTEWTSSGTTKFYSENNGKMIGDNVYATDNVSTAPTLMFYFYHAKNITTAEDLGTVVVTLEAAVPKNEIEYEIKLVTITITLQTRTYEDDDAYDASITYGKKYDILSTTPTNITNKSQFSTYYSLIADTTNINNVDNKLHNYSTYKRSLVSSLVLPVGTSITMIDLAAGDNPEYYYYNIDETDYALAQNQYNLTGEVDYSLSNFIKMDSTDSNNHYDDIRANSLYRHDDVNYIFEEFIFIFDLKDSQENIESLNNSILFELRTSNNDTILSVLGNRRSLMTYNLYSVTNATLIQTSNMNDQYVYYDSDKTIDFATNVQYDQTDNRTQIVDTNYESSSMGINVTIKDISGNLITSQLLSGAFLQVGNKKYHTDSNGVFRIKLASKVSNINQNIIFNTSKILPTGNYILTLTLFASQDGLHESSDLESSVATFPITVVGSDNMIVASIADKEKIITAETGLNENGTNTETFNIKYYSELLDPNLRIIAYRRDTSSIDSSIYNEYDIRSLFAGSFVFASAMGYNANSQNEFFVTKNLLSSQDLTYTLKQNLKSGTYKISFRLYDGNYLIDEDNKYLIVLK